MSRKASSAAGFAGSFFAFFVLFTLSLKAQNDALPAVRYKAGKLIYQADSLGNQIPDYSFCGYKSSNEAIPLVPVKIMVPHTSGDATSDIQKSIDYLAGLPVDENGFRGAILLEKGNYHVAGRFNISASGIVIRGSGPETVLTAVGVDRASLFRIAGKNDASLGISSEIAADYLAVGSTEIPLQNASSFKVGSRVSIERPCTQEWIDAIGMNDFGGETKWLGWKKGTRTIQWERRITAIEGNKITIDAPLTNAIESQFGGGTVSTMTWQGRISNIGIENLSLESGYDSENPKDENHCWFAITMENIENAWVRQVGFRHFAGSAVALYETASKITIRDCISTEPVSEIAGQRRNTFFTMGQQCLFLRCYAEEGRHDFATGFMAAGPNAFVQCEALRPYDFSGAIDSWASGSLFDIVSIDGQALSFKNRGQDGKGAGWTAANSMFWQCSAARIECFAPPTANNWAYGAWAQFAGNGIWYEENSHIQPRSLFFAQLASRLNKDGKEYMDEVLPFEGESTSSPTIAQATTYTALAAQTHLQLKDYIALASERDAISIDGAGAIKVADLPLLPITKHTGTIPVVLQHGWLSYQSAVVFGNQMEVPWWRGDTRPYEAVKASPAISRYVPGRVGHGYTDDLQAVVDVMKDRNAAALDHNYGLWYDRRRDDHERVKRYDAEVWAPFYEQPFSRSGVGEAWDRLSKYDLTKPNPFYWNRLHDFASLAAQEGKFLIHQNYFQHNILEAGAHWVDSPWRPANNINDTGFPEPPPFAGDKRIYLAEQFYDVNHPIRRALHQAYIRQCLDNFKGQTNVIQSISAEFTGPLHFVQFWLDVIRDWEKENGESQLIALSTTKDVQDAILTDPERSKLIDIIDIRYWFYRADGTGYFPQGGVNLAPRQHDRQFKPGRSSFESVHQAVSEYRLKFPEKAVMFSANLDPGFGWAVLLGGGSMPILPPATNKELLQAAAKMLPIQTGEPNIFGLRDAATGLIFYSKKTKTITIDLKALKGKWEACLVNPGSGKVLDKKYKVKSGEVNKLDLPSDGDWVIWIKKKS